VTYADGTQERVHRADEAIRVESYVGEVRTCACLMRQAQLSPGGVQGWRACPYAQPACPTREALPAVDGCVRRVHASVG
jgi:hypothetical protein